MALGDIKDAGILAEFVRWGWPWHGLIQAGTVGATGQDHIQPAKCNSWLIDKGLDPLDLTPDQIAAYAAEGMEWRNYALIAGGTVYGAELDDQTYIAVDDVGDNWMVTLAYSFLGSSQIRITASIVPFGVFQDEDIPLPTPVTKTVDVQCTAIELSNPVSAQGSITFTAQNADLHDVYTNGAKAIVGVLLETGAGLLYLFACIEVEIGGEGGTTGSGLDFTASEVISQPNLCTGTVNVDTNNYTNQGKAVSYDLDNSDCLDDGIGTGIKTYKIIDPGPLDTLSIGTRIRNNYAI